MKQLYTPTFMITKRYLMKYTLILSAIFLLCFTACKKEQANIIGTTAPAVTLLHPQDNYPYPTYGKVDGNFSLYEFNTLYSHDKKSLGAQFTGSYNTGNTCIGIIPGAYYDKDGTWKAVLEKRDCTTLSLDDILFDVSGTDMIFTGSVGTFGELFTTRIYMPVKLKVSQPVFTEGLTISAGKTMTWNTDPRNPKHDVLEITYHPDGMNEDLAKAGYNETVTRKYMVHNTLGTYTFTDEDFAGIPDGAYIDIDIDRVNAQLFYHPEKDEQYTFSAGSTVSHTYKLVK